MNSYGVIVFPVYLETLSKSFWQEYTAESTIELANMSSRPRIFKNRSLKVDFGIAIAFGVSFVDSGSTMS